jgi:hypothetical protein
MTVHKATYDVTLDWAKVLDYTPQTCEAKGCKTHISTIISRAGHWYVRVEYPHVIVQYPDGSHKLYCETCWESDEKWSNEHAELSNRTSDEDEWLIKYPVCKEKYLGGPLAVS